MFFKLNKYGELNNYDVFKVTAFVLMVVDHLGFFFFPHNLLLRAIGRAAFPIYAVLHGITKKNDTEDKKLNYYLLFLGALLDIIFLLISGSVSSFNVLISFFMFDLIFNKSSKFLLKNYLCLFPLAIVNCLYYDMLNNIFEYGLFVLLFMFVGKIFRKVGTNLLEIFYCLFVFITYFLTQINIFNFNINEIVVCGMMLLMIFLFMYDFKFREYHNLNSNKILLFISRYSMELYFLHYTLFMVLFKIISIK